MKIIGSIGEAGKISGIMTGILSIYSITKEKLPIIILTAISALIFSNLVFAQEFAFESPQTVEKDIQFNVSIIFETSDLYDVKIFVHNSLDSKVTRGEYISEVFNTDEEIWQDSWNYLKSSYPGKKYYLLKITDAGAQEICVRLRKTGTDLTKLRCSSISLANAPPEPEDELSVSEDEEESLDLDEEEEKEEDDGENEEEDENDENKEKIYEEKEETLDIVEINYSPSPQEKIFLNSKSRNSGNETNLQVTKTEYFRKGVIYALILFSIFIVLLIILKKI